MLLPTAHLDIDYEMLNAQWIYCNLNQRNLYVGCPPTISHIEKGNKKADSKLVVTYASNSAQFSCHLGEFPPRYPPGNAGVEAGHARLASAPAQASACELSCTNSAAAPTQFDHIAVHTQSISTQFHTNSLSPAQNARLQLCCMTRALGMAVTSVGPALRNVARGAAGDSGGVVSTVCAVARSASARQYCGGFLSPTSRRRFLQGAGTAVGVMLGMMSSAPLRAQAAGVSEASEILKNVQWPEQFPFSKEDFARYDE
jgi:hypothetical protein